MKKLLYGIMLCSLFPSYVMPATLLEVFSGMALQLDAQVETNGKLDNVTTLPVPNSGESIRFQLFIPEAAGKPSLGYDFTFGLAGKNIAEYLALPTGTTWDGTPLNRSQGLHSVTSLLLSQPLYPASGFLGTVEFQVLRNFTDGDILIVTSAFIGDTNTDRDALDSSKANITFTNRVEAIKGDMDLDGDVDFADFLTFAGNFGKTGPPPTPVANLTTIIRDTVLTTPDSIVVVKLDTVTVRDTISLTKQDTIYLTRLDTILVNNTSPSEGYYRNSFSSEDQVSTWSKRGQGASFVLDNGLHLRSTTGNGVSRITSKSFSGTVRAQVNTQYISGENPVYGILLHVNNGGEYSIVISRFGYYSVQRYDAAVNKVTIVKDWTQDQYLNPDGPNQIEILAINGFIAFTFNAQGGTVIEDHTFSFGSLGVYCFAGEVKFSSFTVLPVNPPLLTKMSSEPISAESPSYFKMVKE